MAKAPRTRTRTLTSSINIIDRIRWNNKKYFYTVNSIHMMIARHIEIGGCDTHTQIYEDRWPTTPTTKSTTSTTTATKKRPNIVSKSMYANTNRQTRESKVDTRREQEQHWQRDRAYTVCPYFVCDIQRYRVRMRVCECVKFANEWAIEWASEWMGDQPNDRPADRLATQPASQPASHPSV